MIIRDAAETDLQRITEIYNRVLSHSTAVFADTPVSQSNRTELWRDRCNKGYPTIVAIRDEHVAGFAYFSEFRSGSGYRFTVEHTVHVAEEWRGQGIGRALVLELIARARLLDKHVMIGAVDALNESSLRFHERLGFQRVAYLYQVGYKFDRFLDLVLIQYQLVPSPNINKAGAV